jgi:hypothetical protein
VLLFIVIAVVVSVRFLFIALVIKLCGRAAVDLWVDPLRVWLAGLQLEPRTVSCSSYAHAQFTASNASWHGIKLVFV